MKLLKTFAILLAVVTVFGVAMFGLNFYTGPIIEANNAGAEFAPLLAVMPEGAKFDGEALIYSKDNAAASSLKNVPASVLSVYKEANGLGYAVRCTAESSYSTAPMEITIGISADGKICGVQVDSYNDTAAFDFRTKDPDYLTSYVGKDSALADVGTVAGSTFSSTAFKTAVSEAMGVLISNDLIKEGVKSDAQILEELIATVAPGYSKLVAANASGNIVKAMKAENEVGFAYIMTEGETSYLAVVNAMGACKIYNVEGTDVTADHTALVTEAKAHATANQTAFGSKLSTKVGKMMSGATDVTALELDTFSTVAAAVSFKVEGTTYYGFYSRSVGFHQMEVFFVIDENGAIAKMDAQEFIFDEEYFSNFGGMNVTEYKNGFVGQTPDSWTGDKAVIATATMTSNAMKQSTADCFAAFKTIDKGGEQ